MQITRTDIYEPVIYKWCQGSDGTTVILIMLTIKLIYLFLMTQIKIQLSLILPISNPSVRDWKVKLLEPIIGIPH